MSDRDVQHPETGRSTSFAADVREMCPSCDSTNVENVADPYDDETDDVAMVCQDCGEPYGR
jgi:hypothetical protein